MSERVHPGCIFDERLSERLIRCYLYKFIKTKIVRRPRYDRATGKMTSKRYFQFNMSRPFYGSYHTVSNMVRFSDLIQSNFIKAQDIVFYILHYAPLGREKGRKAFVYFCEGAELQMYLAELDSDYMQNITIFDSSFSWAIDIFEDLVPGFVDYKDVVLYFKRPR